jgi:tRNA threonylcarbamoyladenosine biosynthesis protein TsaB
VHILALDTSTSLAGLALVSDGRILAESVFTCDRTLSARLLPEIGRLLGLAGLGHGDLNLLAAAIGPGSFTGVRCGVATVQGLALATATPCVGFSTLALLAMDFPLASLPVCALLDARKGEVYAGLYDCSSPLPLPCIAEHVTPPDRLLDRLAADTGTPVIFTGDGALRYRDLIIARLGARALFPPLSHTSGRPANGALLALDAFQRGLAVPPARLQPVYLRPSEAEYAKIGQQNPTPHDKFYSK